MKDPTTKAGALEPTLKDYDEMLRQVQSIPVAALGPEYSADVTVVMQSVIRLLEDWKSFWVKEASDAATRAALKAQNDDWKLVHVLLLDADTTDMGIKKDRDAIRKWISEATKIAEKNCPDHKSDSKLSALAGGEES